MVMTVKQWKTTCIVGALVAFAAVAVFIGLKVKDSFQAKRDYRPAVLKWIDDNYGYSGVKILEWDESVAGPGTSDATLMVEGRHEVRVLIEQDDRTVAGAGERGLGLVEFHLVIEDGKVEERR